MPWHTSGQQQSLGRLAPQTHPTAQLPGDALGQQGLLLLLLVLCLWLYLLLPRQVRQQ
jgi:hypothetical protein